MHLHDHDGEYTHGTRSARNRKRLSIALLLAGAYMVAEFVGGWITGSLALLADAGHMLSDVASLALSLFALWIATRPATPQRTYGYYRAEILAALVNGAALVAISIFIFAEAYERFADPPEVAGGLMMIIAVGGLLVNLIGLWILNAGREESLNMQGAWLHVFTDALGSVGAIVAGLIIWLLGWRWVDPAASVLIALLVVYSSWRLLAETVGVLMEWAPARIDVDHVRDTMAAIPGVSEVHDLHVWTITSGMNSLSAHVVVPEEPQRSHVLRQIRDRLHERFGIEHITIQIEPAAFEERPTAV